MSDGVIIELIASLTSLITLIISSVTNHKVKKQEKMNEEIQKLNQKIDNNRLKTLRNILVNEYTELIQGAERTKEQLQNITENFEEYKQLGGDTYIDDLHDIWKAQQTGRRGTWPKRKAGKTKHTT